VPCLVFAVQPPPGGGYAGDNTALGDDALYSLAGGSQETALGYHALYSDVDGIENTAVGANTLAANTHGYDNAALGVFALTSNTTGFDNDALGRDALYANTTGAGNCAVGDNALERSTTGNTNCAFGNGAMGLLITGSSNVAIGPGALGLAKSSNYNIAIGYAAFSSPLPGTQNIAVGYEAGQALNKGSNNIMIANAGSKRDDGVIRLGTAGTQTAAYIAGIAGTTVPSGAAVVVGSDGQLGVMTSSARFKDDIRPMKDASDVILSLQPVTFRYKKELDSLGTPQFGLVAEQVAKVDPDLVARDEGGKPYTVRYEAVNAMLLNEFLKEHREVEAQAGINRAQAAKIETLEKSVGRLVAAVQAQAAEIGKVSAQVRASALPARLVVGGE
jgi:hypothetical protein